MEKHRSVLRGQFTKKANILETLLITEKNSPTEIELKATYKGLINIKEKIDKLDEEIKNKILLEEDESLIEKEFDEVEKYECRWLLLVEKYNSLLKENIKDEKKEDQNNLQLMRLPRIEVPKFDGNSKNWLPFWGQFQKIHGNVHLDTEDKFVYLLQSITPNTEARNLVESYPINGDNYQKCIDHLKSRYAREDLLIQLYVRELLSLILQQTNGEDLDLATLYDKVSGHLRALETLGVTKKHAAFILPMVESALPRQVLKTWQRTGAHDNKMEDELGNLLIFLQKEVESDQRIKIASTTFSMKEPEQKIETMSPSTAQCLTSTSNKKDFKKSCIWCDKDNHTSLKCYKLNELTINERKDVLTKKKACTICLRKGHNYKICRAYNIRCLICGKRHSTTICYGQNLLPKTMEAKKEITTTTASSTHSWNSKNYTTLLQTVVIQIEYKGKKLPIRALFDSGSQRSYIRKQIIEELNIPEADEQILTHSLFGGTETNSQAYKLFNLNISSLDSSYTTNLLALGQSVICKNVPRFRPNNVLRQVLENNQISLTDQQHYENEISLLIGADYLGFYLTGEVKQLQNGLVAINTKFGWTLQGKQVSENFNFTTSLFISQNDNLSLTDYWSLEMMGIQDPAETKSKEEKTAEIMAAFQENIECSEEGRYEVKLPFKVGHEDLLSNYEKAKVRLYSTTNKLISNGKFREYHECFQKWHSLGIIEEVPPIDIDHNTGHYLPHKAIIKESSLTCTLRPVFDASAKDKNGLSLNSCLEKGYNFISLIPNLLISFRTGAIGITADIEKAFLQISLPPTDRNYLKFLWWENDSFLSIKTYRHCRVVFGLTSSPFLLAATLLYHLNNIKGELKGTASLLVQSWYVDNCIISLDTEEETLKFITESKSIMQKAKFNLRMWTTAPMKINESGKDVISILGLKWDTISDCLYCNTENLPALKDLSRITKRQILSLTQRIFDPIGYTAPVMLIPKLILQETWERRLQWDDELPSDLLHNFKEWYKYINYLDDCRFSRRLTSEKISECKLSIHLFCDASKQGYGAGVLLRAEKGDKVSIQLIAARSRVTPPKKISIPRLELLAALMGSRLLKQVKENNNLKCCTVYCWTDSSVVLTWIKQELPLNNFVGNRIKEIRQHTDIEQWRHIPGTDNWADVASRGCSAKTLLDRKWWKGPAWLYLSSDLWPHSEIIVDEQQVHLETKKAVVNAQVCTKESLLNKIQAYFSKYTKLIRMVAWMLRFIYNMQNKINKRKSELTYSEFEKAEKVVIKLIQKENEETLKKDSFKLTIFHDKEGILRIKTKITLSSEFPENTKIPFLLPAKNPIVMMMVKQRHQQLQHAGSNQVIVNLRARFWIIGIRRLVKSVISKCVTCNRYRLKPVQAPTAPLPPERVTCTAPFQTTGVDLAGPLYLRSKEKCWIVLYTCAVYRAVHLELTRSLSTEAFIMTLRRFIARRGRASLIMSDHGTNFLGTKNLLTSIDWEEVQRCSTIRQISWKMNVPTAAWWGGYWERLIGIMKNLLRRVIGNALLTYDELTTVICECEAVMNGRPLTYINQDKDVSLEPLTPANFIQPIPNTDVADLDQIDSNNLNKRVQYLQVLMKQFKNRFKTEYLSFLVQKGKENKDILNIGDIVIIETDEKRIKWPLGIVEKLFTGKDGIERTAQVKTSTGTKIRPVQKLYKLEVSTDPTVLHIVVKMPLVMSKDEWSRLSRWTDQDREDRDVAQKREYIQFLDRTSKEMTKSWPNSLENVNKRNEELRRERIEAAEQANAKFYKRYLKRQKEEQQRLMYSARDVVFKSKDAPKFLLSAVMETVIQKERMEQLKFLEEQRRLQALKKKKEDDEIIMKAKEWHELMTLRKQRRFDANKQQQKEILDQAREIAERNRLEYETELNLQKIDNIQAKEQMDAIKEFEDKFKAAEKARIWSDMERSRQELSDRRREQAARDKMDDDLINVLLKSRARIEHLRAKTEQDVRNEKLRVLENISQKLESGDAARDAKEQAILNKAIKEKESKDEARRQADIRKNESFKQQRVATREQFLKDEEQRIRNFNTMRQWEIMNRFKNAELYEQFQEKLRNEKERKTKEYKEDILRLWKEREDREARERAETRLFYGELAEKKLRDADNKLLCHGRHLVEEAKTHGRPVFALERAIDRYCKQYRLYPMPELPSAMREHFQEYVPLDTSAPDPQYREPTPPPPDLGPDAPDDDDADTKRDGLRNISKVEFPKLNGGKIQESVEDYKRAGRADGLQRNQAQHDNTLPAIEPTSSNTADCKCFSK